MKWCPRGGCRGWRGSCSIGCFIGYLKHPLTLLSHHLMSSILKDHLREHPHHSLKQIMRWLPQQSPQTPFKTCCVIFYITLLILRSDKFREHTTSFFFVYGNSNHLASSPQYSHQTIMRLKVMCLSTSLIITMELIFTEEIV
jgi:hypothetical protein